MISDFAAVVFGFILLILIIFSFWTSLVHKSRKLLHRLFLVLSWVYGFWVVTMLLMWLTPPAWGKVLQVLDSLSYVGVGTASLYFLLVYSFTKAYEKPPRWWPALFIIPVATIPICLTNDFHHLQYEVFSLVRSELVFGPFVLVTGVHSYLCFILALLQLYRSKVWKQSHLFLVQSVLLTLAGLCPLVVSSVATFSGLDLSIAATPLSYAFMVLFCGVAIYQFNLLDVTPFSMESVSLDAGDCCLVLGTNGMVLSFNDSFAEVFCSQFGIEEHHYIRDFLKRGDIIQKTALYNLISAVDKCRLSSDALTYDDVVDWVQAGEAKRYCYSVAVSRLEVDKREVGFSIIFRARPDVAAPLESSLVDGSSPVGVSSDS